MIEFKNDKNVKKSKLSKSLKWGQPQESRGMKWKREARKKRKVTCTYSLEPRLHATLFINMSVRPSVCPVVHGSICRSNSHHCSCPTARYWCCREFSLVVLKALFLSIWNWFFFFHHCDPMFALLTHWSNPSWALQGSSSLWQLGTETHFHFYSIDRPSESW